VDSSIIIRDRVLSNELGHSVGTNRLFAKYLVVVGPVMSRCNGLGSWQPMSFASQRFNKGRDFSRMHDLLSCSLTASTVRSDSQAIICTVPLLLALAGSLRDLSLSVSSQHLPRRRKVQAPLFPLQQSPLRRRPPHVPYMYAEAITVFPLPYPLCCVLPLMSQLAVNSFEREHKRYVCHTLWTIQSCNSLD
jgi:hypothetical protein